MKAQDERGKQVNPFKNSSLSNETRLGLETDKEKQQGGEGRSGSRNKFKLVWRFRLLRASNFAFLC